MAFCPRCGAPTSPGMRFCGSCGESLGAGVAPAPMPPPPPSATYPPTAMPPAQPPAPRAGGPIGETREPWIVVLLSIVTLGLYGHYYWWVASREVDDHTQRLGNSHNLVRIGTIISLVAGVVMVFALLSFLGTLFSDLAQGREPTEEEIVGMVLGGLGIFLLVATAGFVGSIVRLVGKWRMWSALEQSERARLHPNPLSAGLMLALVIGAWFVPFFGWILPLIVLYMTQEHLNDAWRAAGATQPWT